MTCRSVKFLPLAADTAIITLGVIPVPGTFGSSPREPSNQVYEEPDAFKPAVMQDCRFRYTDLFAVGSRTGPTCKTQGKTRAKTY